MEINDSFLNIICSLFERDLGWPPLLDDAQIDESGLQNIPREELANRIWQWLDKNPDIGGLRGTAYWVLGKRYCPEDKDRFVAALRFELSRDPYAVYQIMIALDNIRESIFTRDGSSILEVEDNLADAKRYLQMMDDAKKTDA